MIVPVEKSIGQNSAYRHQIMTGASETKRSSLFCKVRTKTFQSEPPNPLSSARDAATFCAASPRTQAAARGDSIRAEAATPGGYLPRRRLRMRTHPTRHLNIVGAGGNKVTQRCRLETGGSEKPAIHRTIVMIRARPAE